MAYGSEVHFGYPNTKSAFEAADRLGVKVLLETDPITYDEFMTGKWQDEGCVDFETDFLQPKLDKAFEDTLTDFGWEWGGVWRKGQIKPRPSDERYRAVNSPWGMRQVGIWNLESVCDTDEMGDRLSDLTFGVNLSSRYYPCILDMENEHGGIDNVFTLNDEMFGRMNICKSNIVKQIPELADGVFYIRQLHY